MKSLPLINNTLLRLEEGFRQWLELMGYAGKSVYSMPNYVREFLFWTETTGKPVESVTPKDIQDYFFYLGKRRKQRRPGFLSRGYLQKHLQSIKRFSVYLRETEQGTFETDLVLPTVKQHIRDILTQDEISRLYQACDSTPIGLRDRAMLGVYYGCGLRRNEGTELDTDDFLREERLLFVRQGKNYRQRYVPVVMEVKQDFVLYLDHGRNFLQKKTQETSFFLSERGARSGGQSLSLRLKALLVKAGIEKRAGLHSLRHSVATHLLQSGMNLQDIARFLGHSSLESTQVYTHIINDKTLPPDEKRIFS